MDKYTQGFVLMDFSIVSVFNLTVAALSAVLAYLAIDTEVLCIYMALMTIDLLTGVTAAFVRHETIAKRVFMAGVATKAIMLSVPFVIALLVKMNSSDLAYLTKWTMVAMGISETISILNNYLKVKGKETLPEIEVIALLSKHLRSILLRLFAAAEVKIDAVENEMKDS